MTASQVFPTVLIVLDVCAGLVYLVADKDLRLCLYWLAAAALTFAVTFKDLEIWKI